MILASFASRTTSFGTRRDALGKKKLVRLVMLGILLLQFCFFN